VNRVDGKVAVVTGGSQGLGAAVVRQLALAGAAGIVACGRNGDKGHAVADSVRNETGVRAEFVVADLALVGDCRKVIAAPTRPSAAFTCS
jgi:NAD(P)-dependent dehydrogenase (short-subunit alcohol dehydrogenase family)